jgi:hypothetical protein
VNAAFSPRRTLDRLARELNFAVGFADEAESMLEERIIALEEITAARWPRRVLVRRRLARRLRASVRPYAYAGRSFRGRRLEAVTGDLIRRVVR